METNKSETIAREIQDKLEWLFKFFGVDCLIIDKAGTIQIPSTVNTMEFEFTPDDVRDGYNKVLAWRNAQLKRALDLFAGKPQLVVDGTPSKFKVSLNDELVFEFKSPSEKMKGKVSSPLIGNMKEVTFANVINHFDSIVRRINEQEENHAHAQPTHDSKSKRPFPDPLENVTGDVDMLESIKRVKEWYGENYYHYEAFCEYIDELIKQPLTESEITTAVTNFFIAVHNLPIDTSNGIMYCNNHSQQVYHQGFGTFENLCITYTTAHDAALALSEQCDLLAMMSSTTNENQELIKKNRQALNAARETEYLLDIHKAVNTILTSETNPHALIENLITCLSDRNRIEWLANSLESKPGIYRGGRATRGYDREERRGRFDRSRPTARTWDERESSLMERRIRERELRRSHHDEESDEVRIERYGRRNRY